MLRNDIEMILLSVKVGADAAVFVKSYQEGTLIRNGAGGLPPVRVSALAEMAAQEVFSALVEDIPEEVLKQDLNFEYPEAKTLLEYTVVFYGKTRNGEHGEHADWGEIRGLRFAFDPEKPIQHPLLSFLDGFVVKAAYLTESWYFDVMIEAGLNMKSAALPETMIAMPPEEGAVEEDFSRYVTQIAQANSEWTLNKLAEGKIYSQEEGGKFRLEFTEKDGGLQYFFHPIA